MGDKGVSQFAKILPSDTEQSSDSDDDVSAAQGNSKATKPLNAAKLASDAQAGGFGKKSRIQ